MDFILHFINYIYEKFNEDLLSRINKNRTEGKFENDFDILIKDKLPIIKKYCKITKTFLTLLGFKQGMIKFIITTSNENVDTAWGIIFANLTHRKHYLRLLIVNYLLSDYIITDPLDYGKKLYDDYTVNIHEEYNKFIYIYDDSLNIMPNVFNFPSVFSQRI